PPASSKAEQEPVPRSFGQVGVGLLQAAGQLSKQEHPHQLIYGQLGVYGCRQFAALDPPTKRVAEEGAAWSDDPFAIETTKRRVLRHLGRHPGEYLSRRACRHQDLELAPTLDKVVAYVPRVWCGRFGKGWSHGVGHQVLLRGPPPIYRGLPHPGP